MKPFIKEIHFKRIKNIQENQCIHVVHVNFQDFLTKNSEHKTDLFRIGYLGPKFQRIRDIDHRIHQRRADGPLQTLHRIHKLIGRKKKLRRHM